MRRGGRRRVHRKFESHERLFQLVEERRPQTLLQAQPRRRVGRAPPRLMTKSSKGPKRPGLTRLRRSAVRRSTADEPGAPWLRVPVAVPVAVVRASSCHPGPCSRPVAVDSPGHQAEIRAAGCSSPPPRSCGCEPVRRRLLTARAKSRADWWFRRCAWSRLRRPCPRKRRTPTRAARGRRGPASGARKS